MTCNHTIHKHNHHYGWDNSIEPTLTVAPGKTVEVQTVDASGGQLSANSTLADLAVVSFNELIRSLARSSSKVPSRAMPWR